MALLVQAIAVDQNNARYHLGAACIGGGRTSHCGVVGIQDLYKKEEKLFAT